MYIRITSYYNHIVPLMIVEYGVTKRCQVGRYLKT